MHTDNETDIGPTPPADIDAERCAIASMMLSGDDFQTFDLTAANLRAESFYLADHGIIFDTLQRMRRADIAIDAITTKAELGRAKLYEDIGGDGMLAKILNSVPSHAHGPYYSAIIREKYQLREIIRTANSAIRRVYAASNHDKAAEISRHFYNDLASIVCTGDANKIFKLSEVVADVMDSRDSGEVHRYPTGLIELDDMIGGIAKGRFTQVGGRPAMGKSLLCKQILLNIASRGIPCGIVSIEETREKIGQNYLSNVSGIENKSIVFNTLGEKQVSELVATIPAIHKLPIFISDSPVRLSEVESAITAMVMRHGCEVVMVDYLQLITPDEQSENENREITRTSKALKAVFKRLNVAGIVPVQLNRGNETGGVRKPTLRDLRGSGSLEQDGDCIILLHREDYYHKGEEGYEVSNQIEAILAKNKDGRTGTVPLYFEARTQRTEDWDKRPCRDYSPDHVNRTEGMF